MFGWIVRQVLLLAGLGGLLAVVLDDGRLHAWLGGTASSTAAPPAPSTTASARTMAIPADRSGHFVVNGEVDGVSVRFLVDTGASDVVLSAEDAGRIGLRLRDRDYTAHYQTANGVAAFAPVTLREVSVGHASIRDVAAAVSSAPIGTSLLGMSFLRRLDGYAVEGDRLILSW